MLREILPAWKITRETDRQKDDRLKERESEIGRPEERVRKEEKKKEWKRERKRYNGKTVKEIEREKTHKEKIDWKKEKTIDSSNERKSVRERERQ